MVDVNPPATPCRINAKHEAEARPIIIIIAIAIVTGVTVHIVDRLR